MLAPLYTLYRVNRSRCHKFFTLRFGSSSLQYISLYYAEQSLQFMVNSSLYFGTSNLD